MRFLPPSRRPGKSSIDRTPVCEKPKAEGACQGNFTRYFYEKTSGKCRAFSYSGCLGNNNRFMTMTECRNACAHKALEVRRRQTCNKTSLYTGNCSTRYFPFSPNQL